MNFCLDKCICEWGEIASCVLEQPECLFTISFGTYPPKCEHLSCFPNLDIAGMFSSECRNCLANQVETLCEPAIYCRPNFADEFFLALKVPLETLNFHASFLGIPIGNKQHQAGNGTHYDKKPKHICPATTSPGMDKTLNLNLISHVSQ